MAANPNPTFGCGQFLPGYGPFNVPQYADPPTPGVDEPVPPSPGIMGGGSVWEHPPTGHPDPIACECCTVDEYTQVYIVEEYQQKIIKKTRVCVPVGTCVQDPTMSIQANIEELRAEGYDNIQMSPPGAKDNESCASVGAGCCNAQTDPDCCPEIVITGEKKLTPPGGLAPPDDTLGLGEGVGEAFIRETPTTPAENTLASTSNAGGERIIPEISIKSILTGKLKDNIIDLKKLLTRTSWGLTKQTQTGSFDPDIEILIPQSTSSEKIVINRLYTTNNLFSKVINKGIDYTIRNNNLFKDWNSGYGYELTQQTVTKSIDAELLKAFKQIKKIDGSKLSRQDIFTIFFTRIMDGTILNSDLGLDPLEFFMLARKSKNLNVPEIIRSTNPIQNQGAALAWLELNSVPASVSGPAGEHINQVMNWQFLPTDINMFIPVIIDGVTKPLFVTDARTFSAFPTLQVLNGDYVPTSKGRLICSTERDHTIIPSEGAMQTAIKLLGGTGERNLSVSSPYTLRVELSNNLNEDGKNARPKILFAKLIPSSIETQKTPQSLLYTTKATYELTDSRTTQGLSDFNDYIKQRFNHRIFCMAWDDIFWDHLLSTSACTMEQEDVIFHAPKTNKNIPLLTRNIPPYIGFFSSNRQKYLTTNIKSAPTIIDPEKNIFQREIKMGPTLNSDLWKGDNFVKNKLGWPEGNTTDILGKRNVQNIISVYDSSATIYKKAYKVDGVLTTGEGAVRRKAPFRYIYDILVNNLKKNYFLEKQGIGEGVFWFDLFSRFTLTEFNRFMFLGNSTYLIPLIGKGLLDIQVFSPLKYAGEVVTKKTCLLKRKTEDEGADTIDSFPPIKRTNLTEERILVTTRGVEPTFQGITATQRNEAREGRTASTV